MRKGYRLCASPNGPGNDCILVSVVRVSQQICVCACVDGWRVPTFRVPLTCISLSVAMYRIALNDVFISNVYIGKTFNIF